MPMLLASTLVSAVETAPGLTEREIIERLTRLEEGQNTLREDMNQLREDMKQLRAEIQEQVRQLRVDMNAQFDRMVRIMLGILAAFAALVATTIGFALWDRRTMVRPFESKVREIEEELSQNRQRLHSLLEALRALGQSDDKVAEVLHRFKLL